MDLFALVADKNMQFALQGALARPESLGTRGISSPAIRVHAGRDGGARTTGAEILALQKDMYDATLLVLDFEGCGSAANSAVELEAELDEELHEKVGPRSKAIVVEPECDIWMWGSDNVLADVFGWTHPLGIRAWLDQHGFQFAADGKPVRPKEALDAVVRQCRMQRSSSLYRQVTSKISLNRCTDPAYIRLRDALRTWFPPQEMGAQPGNRA